ncbi:MAG: hypothetical protein H6Q63_495, partial [Firmicutes bacterium]|nr:hypothetical protein [Bacillota bacterium]
MSNLASMLFQHLPRTCDERIELYEFDEHQFCSVSAAEANLHDSGIAAL